MKKFPRTLVGGISLSRMIIGTNWFLGYSHTSQADDDYIKENVCNILEVYFNAGVDTIMGQIQQAPLKEAILEAEQRTGVKAIIVSTPAFEVNKGTPNKGFDIGKAEKILDEQAKLGVAFCMPHQSTTDSMVDKCSRELRRMDMLSKMIRERNMIPGLSTHMPEAIVYADETRLDVETYISIYNSMGFLMQIEVDWVSKIIENANKPVMTIKPLAAGQIRPFQGLNFVWNTLRDIDMVTVGTMSPKEAEECIELSMAILEKRNNNTRLQTTRSKTSLI